MNYESIITAYGVIQIVGALATGAASLVVLFKLAKDRICGSRH